MYIYIINYTLSIGEAEGGREEHDLNRFSSNNIDDGKFGIAEAFANHEM